MQNQMTPAEALTILDQVCSGTSMGRQAHVQVIQAVAIIKSFLPPEPESNGDKPKTAEENKDAATS